MHSTKRLSSGSSRSVHGAIQLLTQFRRSVATSADKHHADTDIELPSSQVHQTKRQMRPLIAATGPAIDEGDAFGIAYGGRDRRDASGKTFRVRVPKKLLLWVGLIFFGLPILLFLYVEGSRFLLHHPDEHSLQHHGDHLSIVHHQSDHNNNAGNEIDAEHYAQQEVGHTTTLDGTRTDAGDEEASTIEQSDEQQQPESPLSVDGLTEKRAPENVNNETLVEGKVETGNGGGDEPLPFQNESETADSPPMHSRLLR